MSPITVYRARVLLGAALLCLVFATPAMSAACCDEQLGRSMIENMVEEIVMNDVARFQLPWEGQIIANCVTRGDVSLCLAPDTTPEEAEAILARLPQPEGDRYIYGARWTYTASGGTGGFGSPITLTYSFIPDGTYIGGGAGEPASDSWLFSRMNTIFYGDTDAWQEIFAECFADWSGHTGVTYIYEPNDDGASFPSSSGYLGTRGDVRIGAHYIDGSSGTLAYNYFPNTGDMVMDTSEYWHNSSQDYRFFRNVVCHEHGHGLGLEHVTPANGTKLMEAYLNTGFLGPQDDDIRGGNRLYGDNYEDDDDYDEAQDLGAFTGELVFVDRSLDSSNDKDWFAFEVVGNGSLDVTLDPIGSYYYLDGAWIDTDEILDLGFEILNGATGSNVLITVNDTSYGESETITGYPLSSGVHYLRVRRLVGDSDTQRYELTMDLTGDGTAVGDETPLAGLSLGVFPNPFNPKTTARFHVPTPGTAALAIFDVQGREVKTFERSFGTSGWMEVSWNGTDESGRAVPSGIYFMRASVAGQTETVRGVLLK